VGPFGEVRAVTLAQLEALGYEGRASEALLPVETALDGIPAHALTAEEAFKLKQGRPVLLLPRQVETLRERLTGASRTVSAMADGKVAALCEMRAGRLDPVRIFHLDAGD
jgi:tRNA pseudouridine55 synthase